MPKEIRIEVISEIEARELCIANNWDFQYCYEGRGPNAGKFMMKAYDNNYWSTKEMYDTEDYIEPKKNFIIATHTDTGLMFIGNKSVTYKISEALKFTEKDARRKAYFMNKKRNYKWITIKV